MKAILRKMGKKGHEAPSPVPDSLIFNLGPKDINADYDLKQELGRGNFSVVKLGIRKRDGAQVAVKMIDKGNINVKLESLQSEVKILMTVKHPNIVNLLDLYEDKKTVYMVMELMQGGELFERICNEYPNGYSEKMSASIAKRILNAVAYLHANGIVHRDLKPENLLYVSPEDDSEIKISDFGLAKIWSDVGAAIRTACGSPNYVAPEVLKKQDEQQGYTCAVDMWSVGVILYVLLCGFCPFYDENMPTLFHLITTGTYSFPEQYWGHVSSEAKDLITKLLVVDPTKRLTAVEALRHAWLQGEEKLSDEPIPHVTENLRDMGKGVRSFSTLQTN